ncbi:hypothetical protein [uncultured Polaribacter sp.]|uniref:hypothetical protein n=1 Tax=uncultured Polaribacter sp. TaxID=174711 RepID=UPI002616D49C|nr:hypothetical protein [uncultured Polaribacter sp.]
MKKIFTIKNIILGILFILIDLIVYIIIGFVILSYEDFYDESLGEYWSLESMTTGQKIAYIGFYFWWILNVILLFFIAFKIFKNLRKPTITQIHN